MKLSIKILIYNFFLRIFVKYITTNATRLQMTAQVAPLGLMWTAWGTTFDMYTDPAQYNTGVVSDMNGLYNANFVITEGIKGILRGNSLVKLTGADRLSLVIPVIKAKRGNIPPPDVKPNIALLSKTELIMKFFAYDPANPTSKKKPPGGAQVGYGMAIMPKGVIPKPTDYVNQIPEKNSTFELYFTLPQVGEQLWIIAYYLSPTNVAGNPGEPFNTTII